MSFRDKLNTLVFPEDAFARLMAGETVQHVVPISWNLNPEDCLACGAKGSDEKICKVVSVGEEKREVSLTGGIKIFVVLCSFVKIT